MKKSDFFEKLNKELDLATPPMSERLKNEPICSAPQTETEQTFSFSDTKKKRLRFWSIATSAASVLIAFALILSSALGAFTVVPAPQYISMQLDINPSVTLVLDKNYTVKKAISSNADADTLLSDETFRDSLIGASADEAAVSVAERAAQTGYFDLEETGTTQDFNEITVSILSDEAMPKEIVNGIENGLTAFFCEQGVYVYAHVEEKQSESAKTEVDELEERDVLWYDFVAASESFDLTALWGLAKRTVFDYAEDLLADALEKYDLFGQIDELNDKIAADPEGKGKNYWSVDDNQNENIAALCQKMKPLLERLYLLYDADCREKGALSYLKYFAASSYRTLISEESIESLRTLNETGISDETFCGVENLTLRLRYYQLISNDFFQEIATKILEGVADGAELILHDIAELTECRMQDRYEKYSVLFSLERSSISESAYAEFLIRIGKN